MKIHLPLTLGLVCLTCINVFAKEQRFDSPNEAVDALTKAAQAQDMDAMVKIFGSESKELISPDPVDASNAFQIFTQRVEQKVKLDQQSSDSVLLELGDDSWPFPIPLVREHDKWRFDTKAGKEEILNRRIGMDELAVINVVRSYVEAQREYASVDRNNDEVLEYAQRLRSTPGKHDGLYWHDENGDDPSPFGPLISEAHEEGYTHDNKILSDPKKPYHGYYFKILTKQGPHAPGEKYDYIINGHMIAGFAMVAWPAEWGNSGVMTFIVNQQGRIFQKDLGPHTKSAARHLKEYDPDPSWKPVAE